MRRIDPLILGAGPAGSAAAITLARGGAKPLILERSRETGDALCGGFLSWRTLATLEALGLPPDALGGHPINRVRVFAGKRMAEAPLPGGAVGLSRRRMDSLLLAEAVKAGAALERGVTARAISDKGVVTCDDGQTIEADSLFLATGKHDVRGTARPRTDLDPAMGLRVRLGAHPSLARMIGDAVELFLFDRGYAGVELQEDGSANICLALRKSKLTEAGGQPAALLQALGGAMPALGDRLALIDSKAEIDAIAAVPYGWRGRDTQPGLFRLGDQAAVIPSLAGEGNGIALASGRSAAQAWLKEGPGAARAWQSAFFAQTRRPVRLATGLWRAGERPLLASAATIALGLAPALARTLASLTRIDP
jgi:menaquinone-9 beta-reductase